MKFFSLFSASGFSNTYLLGPDGGGDAILVDPGVFDAPLLQAVEGNRLFVRWILVTHAHNAHINGIRSLLKVYDADIYANQPSILDFPARHVAGGNVLSLGEFRVRVIETPGHSIDSVSYLVGPHAVHGRPALRRGHRARRATATRAGSSWQRCAGSSCPSGTKC